MKSHKALLLVYGILLMQPTSCAKKTMNERDIRREQLRLNAHKKREELAPLAGEFRGFMIDSNESRQDISLNLEVKDVPESEEGQVDPVLVPTVNGSFSLTYGSGIDMEFITFGTVKADFDSSGQKLDILVANSQFKEIALSLKHIDNQLIGTWSSPSTSLSGEVELKSAANLHLGGEIPQVRGTYRGLLEWAKSPIATRGSLTFSTAQDGVDSFHISASLLVSFPSPMGDENFRYEYQSVEFNPLTRQISLRSDESELYFIGLLNQGEIVGNWYSKRIGQLGAFSFSSHETEKATQKQMISGASGTWFGTVENSQASTQLPKNLMLSFNAVPEAGGPGGLALAGSARFYYGSFSSTEFLEYRFESIDYQPFAQRIVAITQGSPKLTIQCDVGSGVITGKIVDSSLGEVGAFDVKRPIPQNENAGENAPQNIAIAGEYNGVTTSENSKAFQSIRINLVPTPDVGGLKISAAVQMYFGDRNQNEYLTYQFDRSEFNSVTGLLNLSDRTLDMQIKATVSNGEITGEWYSTAVGRMGRIQLSKSEPITSVPEMKLLDTFKGTYQGSLANNSAATNLPERVMFGLITSIDPQSPRGLRVTGNMRLYYGEFGSIDFIELPFEQLQVDPFRRTLTGETGGSYKLTIQGSFSIDNQFVGTVSKGLGEIATFEVQKHVQ